jgi:hypothetical protein
MQYEVYQARLSLASKGRSNWPPRVQPPAPRGVRAGERRPRHPCLGPVTQSRGRAWLPLNETPRCRFIPCGSYHSDLNLITVHGACRFPGLFVWLRDGRRCAVRIPRGCLLMQVVIAMAQPLDSERCNLLYDTIQGLSAC